MLCAWTGAAYGKCSTGGSHRGVVVCSCKCSDRGLWIYVLRIKYVLWWISLDLCMIACTLYNLWWLQKAISTSFIALTLFLQLPLPLMLLLKLLLLLLLVLSWVQNKLRTYTIFRLEKMPSLCSPTSGWAHTGLNHIFCTRSTDDIVNLSTSFITSWGLCLCVVWWVGRRKRGGNGEIHRWFS